MEVGGGDTVSMDLDGGEEVITRKEEVAALPRMGAITKLKPATHCTSILMVPLREGQAAAARFHEGSSPAEIAECVRLFTKKIDEVLRADPVLEMDLASVSDGGMIDLQAQRDSAQRNQARGIYKLRIEEDFESLVRAALGKLALILPNDISDATHEVVADTRIYPGGMVEQIYEQNGIISVPIWNPREQAMSYVYAYDSPESEEKVEKKEYLVRLGKNGAHGTFVPRLLRRRVSLETIFCYGITGQGSGRDFLLPEVADSLGLSRDLVTLRGARGVKQGVGFVGAITFPYDKELYMKVMELLDIASFRLPVGSSNLAITLAASPVELAKHLSLSLVQEEAEEEDDEAITPLELRFEEGALAGPLIPAAVWEARKRAGELAAAAGAIRMAKAVAREISERKEEEGIPAAGGHDAWEGTKTLSCGNTARSESFVQFSCAQCRMGAGLKLRRLGGDGLIVGGVKWSNGAGYAGGRRRAVAWARRSRRRAGASGRIWRWRAMDHLLAWGYDTRGCGGGRRK